MRNNHRLLVYFCKAISIVFIVFIFSFITSQWNEKTSFDENQRSKELKYSDFGGLCPDASTIVVTVIAGGRLGNQVWEYLSVWAVARSNPGWWPAVPRQILNTLQPLFSPLAIPAIEDMAERCNASFWLEELKNCPNGGNHNLLQAALHETNKTRPFLLVLPKYIIKLDATAAHWTELQLQLPFTSKLQKSSEDILQEIGRKIRKAKNLEDDEPLEYVGVHVRRSDYFLFLWYTFSDAKVADQLFYLKAMEEMRRQLHPRHCAFVVVSDDMVWCRKYLSGAPDVEIAGNGDKRNPYFDLALLSACNHTVFAYGTYGFTAAMQNSLGKTIVHAKGGSKNAIVQMAKVRNWTLV